MGCSDQYHDESKAKPIVQLLVFVEHVVAHMQHLVRVTAGQAAEITASRRADESWKFSSPGSPISVTMRKRQQGLEEMFLVHEATVARRKHMAQTDVLRDVAAEMAFIREVQAEK